MLLLLHSNLKRGGDEIATVATTLVPEKWVVVKLLLLLLLLHSSLKRGEGGVVTATAMLVSEKRLVVELLLLLPLPCLGLKRRRMLLLHSGSGLERGRSCCYCHCHALCSCLSKVGLTSNACLHTLFSSPLSLSSYCSPLISQSLTLFPPPSPSHPPTLVCTVNQSLNWSL